MCGIVGVLKSDEFQNQFFNLMSKHSQRGDSAHGFITNELLYRRVGEFNFIPHFSSTAKFILGHVRAPTEGSNNIISNTHPFETEHFFLAHNGLLYNWK